VIGNSILREIVRSYPFAPIPPAHQRRTRGASIFQRLLFPQLMHSSRHQFERLGFVFMLRSFLLHVRHDSRGNVSDPHGRFGGVDVLSARSGGAHGFDL
jgi:hypothetical protein